MNHSPELLGGTWQSEAWAVNGKAQNGSGAYRAFLFQPGDANLTDLTALAPAGWVLATAIGISDAGHIVDTGTRNGATRQYLMYPQPQE